MKAAVYKQFGDHLSIEPTRHNVAIDCITLLQHRIRDFTARHYNFKRTKCYWHVFILLYRQAYKLKLHNQLATVRSLRPSCLIVWFLFIFFIIWNVVFIIVFHGENECCLLFENSIRCKYRDGESSMVSHLLQKFMSAYAIICIFHIASIVLGLSCFQVILMIFFFAPHSTHSTASRKVALRQLLSCVT